MSAPAVSVEGVSHSFPQRGGGRLEVLRNISLDVPAHSIAALVGASGCGKSTLLNIIAGLVQPDSGTVRLNGTPSERFTEWRSLTYMFQEDRLLPWRTAAQNVSFALEAGPASRAERQERVAETLNLVGLGGFMHVYPHELSGGMRSRVALARSLVTRPSILLMDEPFSKLDPSIRSQMHTEVLRIVEMMKMTIIFVTHDVEEAVVLADQVVVLHPRPGRVQESRPITLPVPRDPISPEVAEEVRSLRRALVHEPRDVSPAPHDGISGEGI
ncbi:ABC transporter ATP-binding protein [Terrihabitans sp. B22-R8]|uniref:ABC transporter ATP-binding protein n=1 Tax=Terrihabitans sp. B22-R8 TaxID=3425128 RepID=UPI00403CFD16